MIFFLHIRYDKIALTISSDEAGVFMVEVSLLGVKVSKMEVKLEELLQYQFDNMTHINLNGAKVNVNLLIYLVNKKFYK
jgi:Ras GTPase-activating-like protein IQGAP2/3